LQIFLKFPPAELYQKDYRRYILISKAKIFMAKKKSHIAELSYAFLGAAYAYMDYQKRTHFLKTKDGETLFPSEIHIVSEIKENAGIHVTALAEKLSVTVGAVSQILLKLERKGLVIKEKDIRNRSRFLLRLTPEGEAVHKNHLKFHREFDVLFGELADSESEEKIRFLTDFLTGLRVKIGLIYSVLLTPHYIF
jgi:DNA-binding MarR family transcriptional regulator